MLARQEESNVANAGMVVAGKYRVERALAAGGVGGVLLARHIELGHSVAIKCLHSRFLSDPSIVERFKREARLAASLRSDHVVRLHDVGTLDDGIPYMVMEYLDGEDLRAVLKRGPLPVASVVDWMLQACEALAEAHSVGIVHRDLKPENLFLTRRSSGRTLLKVVDFGISKVAPTSTVEPGLSRLTEAGERFGTPLYMSPEQLACSASVDARSDIWALGVVLYELLTGELPFDGDDVVSIMTNVLLSTPVPLLDRRPDAGPVLARIVASCLSRDPMGRPADIGELMDRLRSALPEPPRSADGPVSEVIVIPRPGRLPSSGLWRSATNIPTIASVTETGVYVSTREAPSNGRRRRAQALVCGALATLAVCCGLLTWQLAKEAPPAPTAGIVQEAPLPAVTAMPSASTAPALQITEPPPQAPSAHPSATIAPALRAPSSVRRLAPAPSVVPRQRDPQAGADYMEFGGRR